MKKLTILIVLCLLLSLALPSVHAAGSAYMSGPETVRAGDTITVSFVAGGGIYGGSGAVSYDTSLLTLQGYTQVVGGNWVVEFSGNNFVFYDNNMNSPIEGSATIFKATFTVAGNLAEGTQISVSATGVILSDGNADTGVGTCSYSSTIAPPLSDNNLLASLAVSNATISPAFSADTTEYTASVPFATSSLQVEATAADVKAQVQIGSTSLYAGTTTDVRITVTAENGAVKEYVIHVARGADPNYVKSSNADLKSLEVADFLLSPAFDPSVTQYYVWLPFEQEAVSLSAAADHNLASVQFTVPSVLSPGIATSVPITVTAEDGTTQTYTLKIFRAPAHHAVDAFLSGQRPEQTVEPTEPAPTEPATEPTVPAATEPPVTEPTVPDTQDAPQEDPYIPPSTLLIVIGCFCLVIGAAIGFLLTLLFRKKTSE